MLEDNLSKSPPHFLWETQKGASHFVTCKSHSSPTLIPRLFMCLCHNATSVWCLGIGDARVSPAHQPLRALRDETPFPESPSVYPGRVPSPVSSPGASSTLPTWGWPGRVTAHNWKSQFPVRGLVQAVQSYSRSVHRKAEHTTAHPSTQKTEGSFLRTSQTAKHYQIHTSPLGEAGGCFKSTSMTL